MKSCPQCKGEMEKMKFDVGYGLDVDSFHCKKCGFNATTARELKSAISSLQSCITSTQFKSI